PSSAPADLSSPYTAVGYLKRSVQVSVPVLYLIWRSRQPWSDFGIARPAWRDLGWGLGVWLTGSLATGVSDLAWLAVGGQEDAPARHPDPAYAWVAVASCAN